MGAAVDASAAGGSDSNQILDDEELDHAVDKVGRQLRCKVWLPNCVVWLVHCIGELTPSMGGHGEQ